MKAIAPVSLLLAALYCSVGAQTPPQNGKSGKPGSPAQAKPQPPPIKPGKDRWLVKTASDADAAGVDAKTVRSTIEELRKLPRPKDFTLQETPAAYQAQRAEPVEKTVFSIEADIVDCQLMNDGDYHVTLRGASGETIAMEMPDPAFVDEKSPFYYAMKAAREKFASKVKPEREKKPALGHATITGIGFFGRSYGKSAPPKGANLIQLHPVLDFGWQDAPSKEFADRAESAKRAKEAKDATVGQKP